MLSTQDTTDIVKKFGGETANPGKTEVQVAIATARINYLTEHFASHKHDYHSKRGLMKLIGQRRRLLRYLNNVSEDRYKTLIGELGLRK